jgi:acid phosphatase family membrane protein YuiD
MSDNYIIEIRPKFTHATVQAGIVVRDGHGFRFFAAAHAFNALEGQFFKSPKAAEQAALQRADNTKFSSSSFSLFGAS